MTDFGFDIFPSGVLGGDGRRLRPGSRVEAIWNDERVVGEVTGWGGRRGVEVSFDEEPWMVCFAPHELTRVDEHSDDALMAGVTIVDPDAPATAVIIPLGGRDLQYREGVEVLAELSEIVAAAPTSAAGSGGSMRGWCEQLLEVVGTLATDEQARAIHELFDMPMLRRVLDEAVLPPSVDRLIAVVTDQDEPQASDTAGLVPLMELWLRGRGHLDDDPPVRPIERITAPIRIGRLPFQLDAVVHQVRQSLSERLDGVTRASVVVAGGTPAMMYGTLIAADLDLGSSNVISVQVPQDWVVDGEHRSQPLIEMSLADSLLGQDGD